MTPDLLLELSELFTREAERAAFGERPHLYALGGGQFFKSTIETGSPVDEDEADRLDAIADELRERAGKAAA